MAYESLDSGEIIATVVRLDERIQDRFPDSGLGNLCKRLLEIAQNMEERVRNAGDGAFPEDLAEDLDPPHLCRRRRWIREIEIDCGQVIG